MDAKKASSPARYYNRLLQRFVVRKTSNANRSEQEDPQVTQLRHDLRETNRQLQIAYTNFNAVSDQSSISYYTYLIKALETKYGALLQQAKILHLQVSSNG